MVKKGQKDIFSSQFFTRKSLEVFLDHLRLKTKFCKKCQIFLERVPYQKKRFLYFWKSQTEWFFLKLNHVSEIWRFEKLYYRKPDFSQLSKQLSTKVSKSFSVTFWLMPPKKLTSTQLFTKRRPKTWCTFWVISKSWF